MARIFFITLFILHFAVAQSLSVYFTGYILHKDQKTEKCLIKVPINMNNQMQLYKLMKTVTVKRNYGHQITYNASEISGFGFKFENRTFKFIAIKNHAPSELPFKKEAFMQLEEEGDINLYSYHYDKSIKNFFNVGYDYFIVKKSSAMIRLKDKSDLLSAVMDNDMIFTTIYRSTVMENDVATIVRRYNNHKKQNATDQGISDETIITYDE